MLRPSPYNPHPGKDVKLMPRTTSVSDFQRMMADEQAADQQAEREEIVDGQAVDDQRPYASARVTVDGSGSVIDVRPAEMTPDRGDVTQHHTMGDDDDDDDVDDDEPGDGLDDV